MTETILDEKGRAISYKEIDPADMLDLMEAAGSQSTNQGWMRMAMVVASVTDIGGVPVPAPKGKEDIRRVARTLGNDGLVALNKVMFGDETTSDAAEVAKN